MLRPRSGTLVTEQVFQAASLLLNGAVIPLPWVNTVPTRHADRNSLGVETTVDACDVGFFSSTFQMNDLAIANPEGFGDQMFLELGKGFVEIFQSVEVT